VDTCGGSSPSLSKDADRTRFCPGGARPWVLSIFCSTMADEVVDVVQPVVLYVQGVPAEP